MFEIAIMKVFISPLWRCPISKEPGLGGGPAGGGAGGANSAWRVFPGRLHFLWAHRLFKTNSLSWGLFRDCSRAVPLIWGCIPYQLINYPSAHWKRGVVWSFSGMMSVYPLRAHTSFTSPGVATHSSLGLHDLSRVHWKHVFILHPN